MIYLRASCLCVSLGLSFLRCQIARLASSVTAFLWHVYGDDRFLRGFLGTKKCCQCLLADEVSFALPETAEAVVSGISWGSVGAFGVKGRSFWVNHRDWGIVGDGSSLFDILHDGSLGSGGSEKYEYTAGMISMLGQRT